MRIDELSNAFANNDSDSFETLKHVNEKIHYKSTMRFTKFSSQTYADFENECKCIFSLNRAFDQK